MIRKTYEQCFDDPVDTVYADWEQGPYRILILRGPVCVNAYIGVKPGHPLYNVSYMKIEDVNVHGGLTFSAMGEKGTPWPEGWWWFGWDYAHVWDMAFYQWRDHFYGPEDRKWTPDLILAEIPEALESFDHALVIQEERISLDADNEVAI